jgi:Tfp pilus assembly protein FimT
MELIVVLALLATVAALTAPSLSRFFSGRGLQEEARRLLSLTRFARSQAISMGTAMEIWIEPESGAYGLSTVDPYTTVDVRAEDFELAHGLKFDLDEDFLDEEGMMRIVFLPDGTIEGEAVVLAEERGGALSIEPSGVGLGYIIEDDVEETA